jgi:hypothetical protein
VETKHNLRVAYPQLFGAENLADRKSLWFKKTDVIPLVIFLLLLVFVAWLTGRYLPIERINRINENIARVSTYFDERALLTFDLNTEIRKKIKTNEFVVSYQKHLAQVDVIEKENNLARVAYEKALAANADKSKKVKVTPPTIKPLPAFVGAGFIERYENILNGIDESDKALSQLSLNKPNDSLIKKRLASALEFAELSKSIVVGRDVDQYNLGLNESKDEAEVLAKLINVATSSDLVKGAELDWLITRSQETINSAESYMDKLTDQEKRGQLLMADFKGEDIPRRKHEILSFINSQWVAQYRNALELWRGSRTYEIELLEVNDSLEKYIEAEKIAAEEAKKRALENPKAKNRVTSNTRNFPKAVSTRETLRQQQAEKNARIQSFIPEAKNLVEDKRMRFGGKSLLSSLAAKPYKKLSFSGSELIGVKVFGSGSKQRANKRLALREVCGGNKKPETILESTSAAQIKMIILCL